MLPANSCPQCPLADISAMHSADDAPASFPPAGWVGRRQTAEMFGVDPMTLRRWEREGWLHSRLFLRPRRQRCCSLDEINSLIAEFGRLVPPYPDPDRPGCYRVPLVGKEIRRREAIIDAESLPLIEGRRWSWAPVAYSIGGGHVQLSEAKHCTPMRRIILGVTDPEIRISHANGDPLDCRRANLVVRTMSELACGNRKMGTVNGRVYTSQFKGVCWDNQTKKWLVQIRKGATARKIGRFGDELAAAEAYDEAARELFGEHARLNFPDGIDAWLASGEHRRAEQQAVELEAEDAAPAQREAA